MIAANISPEDGNDHMAASVTTGQFRNLPLEPTAFRRSGLTVQREPENHSYYEEKTFDAEEKTVEARSTWYNRFSRNTIGVVADATHALMASVMRRQRQPIVEMGLVVGSGEPIPEMDVVLDILPEDQPSPDIVVPVVNLSVDIELCEDNGYNQGDSVYYHSRRVERGTVEDGPLFLRTPQFYPPHVESSPVSLEEKYEEVRAPDPQVRERLVEPVVDEVVCAMCMEAIGGSVARRSCGHCFCLSCYVRAACAHPLRQFPCPLCRSVEGVQAAMSLDMFNEHFQAASDEEMEEDIVMRWDRDQREAAIDDPELRVIERGLRVMGVRLNAAEAFQAAQAYAPGAFVLGRVVLGPANDPALNVHDPNAAPRYGPEEPFYNMPFEEHKETLFSELEGDNLTTVGHVSSRVYAFHRREHFADYRIPQIYYQSFGVLTRAYMALYDFAPPEPGFDVQDNDIFVRLPIALVRALETYMVGQRHSLEVWNVLQEHCKQLIRDFRDPPGASDTMTLEFFQFYAPLYAFLKHDRREMHERHILITGDYWRRGCWGRCCLRVQSTPRLAYRVCKIMSILLLLLLLFFVISKFGVLGGLRGGGEWLLQGMSDVIEYVLPGLIAWFAHA